MPQAMGGYEYEKEQWSMIGTVGPTGSEHTPVIPHQVATTMTRSLPSLSLSLTAPPTSMWGQQAGSRARVTGARRAPREKEWGPMTRRERGVPEWPLLPVR